MIKVLALCPHPMNIDLKRVAKIVQLIKDTHPRSPKFRQSIKDYEAFVTEMTAPFYLVYIFCKGKEHDVRVVASGWLRKAIKAAWGSQSKWKNVPINIRKSYFDMLFTMLSDRDYVSKAASIISLTSRYCSFRFYPPLFTNLLSILKEPPESKKTNDNQRWGFLATIQVICEEFPTFVLTAPESPINQIIPISIRYLSHPKVEMKHLACMTIHPFLIGIDRPPVLQHHFGAYISELVKCFKIPHADMIVTILSSLSYILEYWYPIPMRDKVPASIMTQIFPYAFRCLDFEKSFHVVDGALFLWSTIANEIPAILKANLHGNNLKSIVEKLYELCKMQSRDLESFKETTNSESVSYNAEMSDYGRRFSHRKNAIAVLIDFSRVLDQEEFTKLIHEFLKRGFDSKAPWIDKEVSFFVFGFLLKPMYREFEDILPSITLSICEAAKNNSHPAVRYISFWCLTELSPYISHNIDPKTQKNIFQMYLQGLISEKIVRVSSQICLALARFLENSPEPQVSSVFDNVFDKALIILHRHKNIDCIFAFDIISTIFAKCPSKARQPANIKKLMTNLKPIWDTLDNRNVIIHNLISVLAEICQASGPQFAGYVKDILNRSVKILDDFVILDSQVSEQKPNPPNPYQAIVCYEFITAVLVTFRSSNLKELFVEKTVTSLAQKCIHHSSHRDSSLQGYAILLMADLVESFPLSVDIIRTFFSVCIDSYAVPSQSQYCVSGLWSSSSIGRKFPQVVTEYLEKHSNSDRPHKILGNQLFLLITTLDYSNVISTNASIAYGVFANISPSYFSDSFPQTFPAWCHYMEAASSDDLKSSSFLGIAKLMSKFRGVGLSNFRPLLGTCAAYNNPPPDVKQLYSDILKSLSSKISSETQSLIWKQIPVSDRKNLKQNFNFPPN